MGGSGVLVLVRGLPGSGKSWLAKKLARELAVDPERSIVSADHYFITADGRYKFERSQLWKAHRQAREKAAALLKSIDRPCCIVDNTNLEKSEMVDYVELAVKHNYDVRIAQPETPWRDDIDELIDRIEEMLQRYDRSITANQLIAAAHARIAKREKRKKSESSGTHAKNSSQPSVISAFSGCGAMNGTQGKDSKRTSQSVAVGGDAVPCGQSAVDDGWDEEQIKEAIRQSLAANGPPRNSDPRYATSASAAHIAVAAAPAELGERKRRRIVQDVGNTPAFQLTSAASTPTNATHVETPSGLLQYATSLAEILRLPNCWLTSSVHFNMKYDLNWLMQQYPRACRTSPMMVVHGYSKGSPGLDDLEAQRDRLHANAQERFIRLALAPNIPEYGSHHTKMVFLFYGEHGRCTPGMRIVIMTANAVEQHFSQMTDGVWVSPLCQRRVAGQQRAPSASCPEPAGTFGHDLHEYLEAYGEMMIAVRANLAAHDLSIIQGVRLVGSVPGRHQNAALNKWGHMRLRQLINGLDVKGQRDVIVSQCSSISSLGKLRNAWFDSNLMCSMRGGTAESSKLEYALVYPTPHDIRSSKAGWSVGMSLPHDSKNYDVHREWLQHLCHKWRSEWSHRTAYIPHIKTYMRYDPTERKIRWFLLTSANLSKAAWGTLQTPKSPSLYIRSYELGLLFMEGSGHDHLISLEHATEKSDNATLVPVPYDLPLLPYDAADEMWCWNKNYGDLVDNYGRRRIDLERN